MRTFRIKHNFKAILTSKVLSCHCSVFGTGNISNHNSQNGCRSNFLLFTETFLIMLLTILLSRFRPCFLQVLGKKFFHVRIAHSFLLMLCYWPKRWLHFSFQYFSSHDHLFCCQTSLLYNDSWGYFSLKKEKNCETCFPDFILLKLVTTMSLLISLWGGPPVVLPSKDLLGFSFDTASTKPRCKGLGV